MERKKMLSRLQQASFRVAKIVMLLGWGALTCALNNENCGATEISPGSASRIGGFGRSAHHRDSKIYMSPNGDVHAVEFQPSPDPPDVLVARKAVGSSTWAIVFRTGPFQGDMHLHLVPGTNGAQLWLAVAKVGGGGDLYLSMNSGLYYAWQAEIKAPLLSIHEAQVYCHTATDCLAVINGLFNNQAKTYYSHWDGIRWCSDTVNPLYDDSVNSFILNTVSPTGAANNYDVIRLGQVYGMADINNDHQLVYSNHTISQDEWGCYANNITVMPSPTSGQPWAQGHVQFGYVPGSTTQLYSELLSFSMARNSQDDFWVSWPYFADPDHPTLNDINIRLRHWSHATGSFNATASFDGDSVAYNFGNLVYDEDGGKFYLFYRKMRKNDTQKCGGMDCQDLCYRTVAAGGLTWGAETCPVRNVIMKQTTDIQIFGGPHPHGNNNFTGSATNGQLAMIYQDECVDGSCYVWVWRGANP